MSLSKIEKRAENWLKHPFSKETQDKVKELYKNQILDLKVKKGNNQHFLLKIQMEMY